MERTKQECWGIQMEQKCYFQENSFLHRKSLIGVNIS